MTMLCGLRTPIVYAPSARIEKREGERRIGNAPLGRRDPALRCVCDHMPARMRG